MAMQLNIDFQEMDDIEVAWQQNYIRNKSNPVWQGLVGHFSKFWGKVLFQTIYQNFNML